MSKLKPTEWVDQVRAYFKNPVDTSDETEIVRALTQLYATFFCQEPQEGSEFDHMVLDTLALLHPKDDHRAVTSRRTNLDRRVLFIKEKLLGQSVIVRPLLEGDPKTSDKYVPLPEYGVTLWIDKKEPDNG